LYYFLSMSSKKFSISKAIIRGDDYVPLVDPEEDDEDAPLDEQREDTDDQRDVSYAPLRSITPPIDDAVMPTLYHSHAVVRREEEVDVDEGECEDAHSRSRSRSRSPSPSPSTKRRKRECDLLVDERHKLNQYREELDDLRYKTQSQRQELDRVRYEYFTALQTVCHTALRQMEVSMNRPPPTYRQAYQPRPHVSVPRQDPPWPYTDVLDLINQPKPKPQPQPRPNNLSYRPPQQSQVPKPMAQPQPQPQPQSQPRPQINIPPAPYGWSHKEWKNHLRIQARNEKRKNRSTEQTLHAM